MFKRRPKLVTINIVLVSINILYGYYFNFKVLHFRVIYLNL